MKDEVRQFTEKNFFRSTTDVNDIQFNSVAKDDYPNNVILLSEFRRQYGYDENEKEFGKLDFEKAFIEKAAEEYSWSTAFLVSLLIIYFISTSSAALYYLYFA